MTVQRQRPPFRVAMASEVRADNAYGSFRGVLDYKDRVEHWQMVGSASAPIAAFEDVDLAGVDGVIGFFTDRKWADAVNLAGVAAVNISVAVENMPLPRVAHDDEAIGRLGAEHLQERGFNTFGFLGRAAMWYSQRRLAGFRNVIEETTGRVLRVLDRLPERPLEADLIQDWLGQLPKPIGIMAANDLLACELIAAATALGLRVPDDVAVVGVDNNHWLTQLAHPPLTSVEPDWQQIGYQGARMLDLLMAGGEPSSPLWIPPLRVVARRSTDIRLADDPLVAQALQYIHENCGEDIRVAEIAKSLRVSRRNLEMRVKRGTGLSPYAAICRARMEIAKRLLVRTDDTLAKIASDCGVADNQFYTLFKRHTGMTPGQYRSRFSNRVTPRSSVSPSRNG